MKLCSYSTHLSLPMSIRLLRVLGAVILLVVLVHNLSPFTFKSATSIKQQQQADSSFFEPEQLKSNLLDGCHHVYLDMGTNM